MTGYLPVQGLIVDHTRVLGSSRYRKAIIAHLSELDPSELSVLAVAHEYDNRCCHEEPWHETERRLLAGHPLHSCAACGHDRWSHTADGLVCSSCGQGRPEPVAP